VKVREVIEKRNMFRELFFGYNTNVYRYGAKEEFRREKE